MECGLKLYDEVLIMSVTKFSLLTGLPLRCVFSRVVHVLLSSFVFNY